MNKYEKCISFFQSFYCGKHIKTRHAILLTMSHKKDYQNNTHKN